MPSTRKQLEEGIPLLRCRPKAGMMNKNNISGDTPDKEMDMGKKSWTLWKKPPLEIPIAYPKPQNKTYCSQYMIAIVVLITELNQDYAQQRIVRTTIQLAMHRRVYSNKLSCHFIRMVVVWWSRKLITWRWDIICSQTDINVNSRCSTPEEFLPIRAGFMLIASGVRALAWL